MCTSDETLDSEMVPGSDSEYKDSVCFPMLDKGRNVVMFDEQVKQGAKKHVKVLHKDGYKNVYPPPTRSHK